MKRTLLIVAAFTLLIACYAVWPVVGLMKIAEAVSRRDIPELSTRMIVPELKRSVIDQVALEYLRVTGRDRGMGQLQINIALGVARAMADEHVDKLMQPEALSALLQQAAAKTHPSGGLGMPALQAPNFGNLSRLLRNTEYAGTWFYAVVPFDSDRNTGFRLHLRLSDWTWKLAGLDLPDTVRTRLANELVQRAS
jgi:hypothetical protein